MEVESDKLDCFQISPSSGFLFSPLLKSHIWRRINLSVKEKKPWLILLTSILYNLLLTNISVKAESNTAAWSVILKQDLMNKFISVLLSSSPFIMFVSPSATDTAGWKMIRTFLLKNTVLLQRGRHRSTSSKNCLFLTLNFLIPGN